MIPGYDPLFFKPSAMLTGYVLKFIIEAQHSMVATQPFVVVSALALVIIFAAFLGMWRHTGMRDILPLAAAFALSPASLLLCGYVELYSLGFAAIVVLLLLLALRVQDGGYGVAVGIALAAALACTLAAVVFVPVTVALLWGARDTVDPRALRRGAAALAMLLIAGIVGVYAVIGTSTESLYLLRLLPGPYVSEGFAYGTIDYVVLSWIHTADMANLLVLIGGAWLPLLLLAGVHPRLRAMLPARTTFAVLVAVPVAVAFLLVANTALGMSRDWDLAALPALLLPFAGMLVYAAFSAQDRSGARLVLPLIVLVQFFTWHTWIDVNADRNTAVRRAADLVALDAGHIRPDFSYYGFGNIYKEYVTQADWEGIFAQLLNMHGTGYRKIDTYDRILRLIVESGKPQVIRPWIDRTARLLLADLEQQNLPADDYRRVDRRRLGEIAARLCLVAQNTGLADRAAQLTDTFAGAFGAWKEEALVRLCFRKETNADLARATVRSSIDSTTGDAFLLMIAAVPLLDVGAWADAAAYLERSIEKSPTEYPAAYLSLAMALLQMRDLRRAEQVLTACIDKCNDAAVRQQAAQMLDRIRSTPQ
jgi:tetratricopeptide (TPR) repeat protein